MAATRVITLIHGTFARNSKWTRREGEFIRGLKSLLPGDNIYPEFPWSGGNSFSARETATKKLRDFILYQHEAHPNAKQYLIAHSHGGNIVMAALSDPFIARHIAGVVCLATPFLRVKKRVWHRTSSFMSAAAGFVCYITGKTAKYWMKDDHFLLLGTVKGFLVMKLTAARNVLTSPWGASVAILAAIVVIIGGFRFPSSLKRRMRLLQTVSEYRLYLQSDQLLILRRSGDEATGILASTQFLCYVVGAFWGIVGKTVDAMVFLLFKRSEDATQEFTPKNFVSMSLGVGILVIVLLWVLKWTGFALHRFFPTVVLPDIEFVRQAVDSTPKYLLEACIGFIALYYATLLLFSLILGVLLMPFGSEFLFSAFVYDISVDETPPGKWQVELLDSPEVSHVGPLAHSIYLDRRIRKIIVDWLTVH